MRRNTRRKNQLVWILDQWQDWERERIKRTMFYHLCCCCCCITSVVSNSVRPHRRQPSRLCHPWDSPGKNTGVGCHFLLQCMKVKNESEVTLLCLTLSDPVACRLPGSSVHGIFQARVLEWGAIAFSQGKTTHTNILGLPCGSAHKEFTCNAGDLG